ncbi:MAG: hypothetical protein R3F38_06190 [Gammaproteobacteria bacterium]
MDLVLFARIQCAPAGEITRLLWADYDRDRKQIVVQDAKDPRMKKGNNLLVALTDEAVAIIDRQPRTDEQFFRTTRSQLVQPLHAPVMFWKSMIWCFTVCVMNVPVGFRTALADTPGGPWSLATSWSTLQRYIPIAGH